MHFKVFDLKARDIMTPRTEISGVDILDSISELKDLFITTGYSKLLIYQNSIDDIFRICAFIRIVQKPKPSKSIMIPGIYS